MPNAKGCELSSSTFICQYPEEASSFEKSKQLTFAKIFPWQWEGEGMCVCQIHQDQALSKIYHLYHKQSYPLLRSPGESQIHILN